MPTLSELLQSNPHGLGTEPPTEAEAKRQRFFEMHGVDPDQPAWDFFLGTLRNFASEAAPQAAMAALPGAGRVLSAAPRMSTALLGGLGLTAGSAAAGDGSENALSGLYRQRATADQRRAEAEMEVKKQRRTGEGPLWQQAVSKVDGINAEIAGLDRQIAEEQRKTSPEYASELKAKEAATPFRERYPEIAGALPWAGVALSAALPAALRGKANMGSFAPGSYAGRIKAASDATEAAISKGSAKAATIKAKELESLLTKQPTMASELSKAGAAAGAGGALAAEGNMLPDQIDAFNLPEGEARDRARERALDPTAYLERAAVGALTGLSGYKAGDLIPKRKPDIARAESLSSILQKGFRDDVATVSANLKGAPSAAPAPPLPSLPWQNQTRDALGRFGPAKKKR